MADCPKGALPKMAEMRALILEAMPEADEVMKYGIPTMMHGKAAVHYAGYKTHIGFYPTPEVIQHFQNELSSFKWAKGSIQFPLDTPLPASLIKRMVEYRLELSAND